jgi:hydroxypyruvate isomerase
MTITFTAHPIETAPKDREIYVFDWTDERWYAGIVTSDYVLADDMRQGLSVFRYWAEIEDMRPQG